jgi:hypothetical protein
VAPSEEHRVGGIARTPFDLNRLTSAVSAALAPRA